MSAKDEPVQLDLFGGGDLDVSPPGPSRVLNGFYYEASTDKFVSFCLGRRCYEEPAKGSELPKEWRERMKKERAI
ncbi:hypothetical protein JJQ72_06465 [Paenibacillus sp. F411]|uniref:hypothetical protein n=1 Tax=Paenibacillus sp. F411 TaxID=2820239 RepID=UPI001AAFF910|nr:hypothetical protein [Paenibacillus sp. F411]MBO2943621.1 hypothetical protein [Paenibacillus sp. F411]